MKWVKQFPKYLVENGLLFEINRKVLHPLGMELVVDVDYENRKWLRVDRLEYVENDPEGILYDEETLRANQKAYQRYLDEEGQGKLDARKGKLGFIVQGESDESES
jgi:hypothetical protein